MLSKISNPKQIKKHLTDSAINPGIMSGFSSITLYDFYKVNAPDCPKWFNATYDGTVSELFANAYNDLTNEERMKMETYPFTLGEFLTYQKSHDSRTEAQLLFIDKWIQEYNMIKLIQWQHYYAFEMINQRTLLFN